MKKIKNKYVIYQGVMNSSGYGDTYAMAYADTLAEAKKIFNKLKKDIKGWVKYGCGSYLTTSLEFNYENCYNSIDYFKINLN